MAKWVGSVGPARLARYFWRGWVEILNLPLVGAPPRLTR
jgi:hypothetical protein